MINADNIISMKESESTPDVIRYGHIEVNLLYSRHDHDAFIVEFNRAKPCYIYRQNKEKHIPNKPRAVNPECLSFDSQQRTQKNSTCSSSFPPLPSTIKRFQGERSSRFDIFGSLYSLPKMEVISTRLTR